MNNCTKRSSEFIFTIIFVWKMSQFRVNGIDCSTEIEINNYCTLTCSRNPHELRVEKLTCTPQVIFITDAKDGFNFHSEIFKDYQSTVTNLIIRHVKFRITETLTKFVSNVFKDMKKLDRLEITSSGLTNNYTWVVPPGVGVMILDNNSYSQLDLSMASNLKSLSLNLNNFKKLPSLPYPNMLNSLHMTYNPMEDLKLQEVAALCLLSTFELQFSKDQYFTSHTGYCICTELKKWTAEYNIEGMKNVKCATPISEIKCKSAWDEAVKLRNDCFKDIPTHWFSIIVSLLVGVLFLGVLCTLAILYYFWVKEDSEMETSSVRKRHHRYDDDEEEEEE